MIRLIRAELLKLRTTRLLIWLALLILGLLVLVVSLTAGSKNAGDLAQLGEQRSLVTFAAMGALISMILGLASAAGEYAHGTVSHTFLATPVRERVVGAKLVTAAVAGVVIALFAVVVASALTAIWVSGKSAPSHLFAHGVLTRDAGILGASALAGALGVGFGAVLRRQTAGIVIALIWLLVGEPVLAAAGVQKYAPGHAIAAVVEAGNHDPEVLRFGAGLLLALAYVLVFAVAGTVAVKRTDVT
jgi:ABC-type transport system involved in multi-copper enzyme maturation permease subunit